MRVKTSAAFLTGLAAALLLGGCASQTAEAERSTPQNNPGPPPWKSVPTFSTENIARQGHFYVGGKWEGKPGEERMRGAMYVETWVPKQIRYPYPVVFIQSGGGQSNIALLQTPDGRPGWAYDFVNNGYTVYMMDYPGNGRSAYVPGLDGNVTPPRSGPLMAEIWTQSTAPSPDKKEPGPDGHGPTWPQFSKYSAWPSDHPNKGRMGDPVFDYFAKTELHQVGGTGSYAVDDIVELLDLIGQPVILLLHSGQATSGWNVADLRPKLVKGIVAAEPVSPPMENTERRAPGTYTPGRLWGVTGAPITYDPPVKDPSELKTVRQEKADGPDLIPCWIQQEPARKLVNLQSIPVLNVAGEASYHRPYAHCTAKWLNQAGVKTTFVGLEEVGLRGNGHQMLSEKNSDGIAKYFMSWLEKNVH
jgi:pimeloyl-ACP methyl ester carboxylesterase